MDSGRSLPYLDYPFSYQDFLLNYLLPNTPCLFSFRLTSSWACFSSFLVNKGSSTGLNTAHLLSLQPPHLLVPVHRPATRLEREDGQGVTVCEDRTLREVLGGWETEAVQGGGMYVKDWHLPLQVECAGGGAFYETPDVFRDDWLNGWERSKNREAGSDFRFVYVGSPFTITLLHRDVYSSNSFSTNLLGRKRWTLFPPSSSHLLRRFPDEPRSQLIPDVRNVEERVFNSWKEARDSAVVVVQEEGETIFVPGGWYHQVENLPNPSDPTQPILSLNHNWLNSTSLARVYQTLEDDIRACELAIDDVREMLVLQHQSQPRSVEQEWEVKERGFDVWEVEWVEQVQQLVRRDSGWGWEEFWAMVEWGVKTSLDPTSPSNDVQPPLTYIREQVKLVLGRYDLRADSRILRDGEVGGRVKSVRALVKG